MTFSSRGSPRDCIACEKSIHWRIHCTGGQHRCTVTHLTFDSNTRPATGSAYTFGHVCGPVNSDGTPMFSFHTLARACYVDVQLVKSSSTANPGVKKIMILTVDFETP